MPFFRSIATRRQEGATRRQKFLLWVMGARVECSALRSPNALALSRRPVASGGALTGEASAGQAGLGVHSVGTRQGPAPPLGGAPYGAPRRARTTREPLPPGAATR